MPLMKDGSVFYELRGRDPHDAIYNKCQEMRRELRHLEQVIARIEGQARAKAPFDSMNPNFSAMFNWYLSALESFFAITVASAGPAKTREAIADFTRRFAKFA